MVRKRVLIVDDSPSARAILSRMLERYDIEVDMSVSAEQAIEYLKSNRPDAIFMDHLMPGMDGLQAVGLIKGNPQTAMIPIMMYTSQEGELYVGQARALGAMGVLPKQVRPVDVSKVLYELHLLPERRDTREAALQPIQLGSASAPAARGSQPGVPGSGAALPGVASELAKRIEGAVKTQAADLRRFILATLDSYAARIVSDMRESLPREAPVREPPQLEVAEPRARTGPRWAAGFTVACAVALGFGLLWVFARGELNKARVETAALKSANTELNRDRQELSDTIKDLTNAMATVPPGSPAGATGSPTARVEPVPYGEMPFDRGRLDALRELATKLEAQGFRGVVKATSFAGQFCLSGNPTDGFTPASAALSVGKCDVIGNPYDESLAGQQHQSLAFANLVTGIRQRTAGAITVAIESTPNSRPAVAYPARAEPATAGDWNRVAAANNRVEFTAEPSPVAQIPAPAASN